MNNFRKVIGILLAILLALSAVPSIAAVGKYFSANISPLQIPGNGLQFDFTVSFANISPPTSNSSINSGIFTLPAGSGLKINSITPSSGSITLSPSVMLPYSEPGALQIKFNGISGVRPVDPPFTLKVTVSAPATVCRTVTWSAQAYAGNSWNGDSFSMVAPSNLTTSVGCVFTGLALCSDSIQTGDTGGGARGFFDKDGTCGPAVIWTFVDNGPIDKSKVLKWDNVPGAAFKFFVFGDPIDVDPTGWPPFGSAPRPLVGWQFASPTSLEPLFKVRAVACLTDKMPAPYGTLFNPLDTTSIFVTMTTSNVTLPATPFPIQIGNERLKVTSKSAASGTGTVMLTVVRGDAGTPVSSHIASAPVASNPLPIDPNPFLPNGVSNPYVGRQDQMCVATQGFTPVGINPLTGKTQIRWWSLIFDVGDGWITANE